MVGVVVGAAAAEDVEVGATQTRSYHAHEYVAGTGSGLGTSRTSRHRTSGRTQARFVFGSVVRLKKLSPSGG